MFGYTEEIINGGSFYGLGLNPFSTAVQTASQMVGQAARGAVNVLLTPPGEQVPPSAPTPPPTPPAPDTTQTTADALKKVDEKYNPPSVDQPPAPPPAEEVPFYKNPYVLVGGGVAVVLLLVLLTKR